MNEFQATDIPLLASLQGGVDARSREYREASTDRADGVVFRLRTKGKPPRLRQLRWLREIFFMTQPPLLAVMQGWEFRSPEVHSQLHKLRINFGEPSV